MISYNVRTCTFNDGRTAEWLSARCDVSIDGVLTCPDNVLLYLVVYLKAEAHERWVRRTAASSDEFNEDLAVINRAVNGRSEK